MSRNFLEQFNLARRAGAPLIAVRTPDIMATMQTIVLSDAAQVKEFNDAAAKEFEKTKKPGDVFKPTKPSPMILQDCARGITAMNDEGKKLEKAMLNMVKGPGGQQLEQMKAEQLDQLRMTFANPVEMLMRAHQLPSETILFMANLHLFFHDPIVLQGIWNLRNPFKANSRSLVDLSQDITLPPILAQDMLVLDEPLPDAEQLAGAVREVYSAVGLKEPDAATLTHGVDALIGLSAFSAETVLAMSIRKTGLDLDQVVERKRQTIEETRGLKVWRGQQRFKNIGGCDNIKEFLNLIKNGKDSPRAIVFQDEIEKQFAGATGGDLSGVTQELLGNQLSFMQDHDSTGIMMIGHPGVAKSDICKAFGNEAGIPTIQLDLGNAKGGIIGESNLNMRTILKVIEAVSRGLALWVCTSNDIKALPAELRSRYTFGTFFFDLPTPTERNLIWNIYFEKYGLKDRERPIDTGWNGREIKNCCLMSHRLGIPLREAAKYTIPMWTNSSERIAELRREANGRYISAAYSGAYKMPEGMEEAPEDRDVTVAVAVMSNKRKINPGEGTPPTGSSKKPVN